MPATRVRVVGSGFTTFSYNGKTLAFCEGVEDSGQRAFSDVGQPYQFIHPLGNSHPVEIATSRVMQGGTLQLTLRELWNEPVWQALGNLDGTWNMVNVLERLAANPQYVTCALTIRPPAGVANRRVRTRTYNNCQIVDIADGDTITVGALSVTKGITVAYTHTTVTLSS